VPPDNLATQDNPPLLHAKPSSHHRANLALKVLPAHLVNPVNLETPVPTDNPASLADNHNPDLQDPKVPLAHPETLVLPDNPETPELPLNPKASNLDLQAQLEMLAPQDNPAALANPETMDNPVNPDPKDLPAHPVQLATPVKMVNPDNPVNPEAKARRVSARNTAPSTVVSSSKTEPADKPCRTHFTQAIPPPSQHTAIISHYSFITVFVFSIFPYLRCFESISTLNN